MSNPIRTKKRYSPGHRRSISLNVDVLKRLKEKIPPPSHHTDDYVLYDGATSLATKEKEFLKHLAHSEGGKLLLDDFQIFISSFSSKFAEHSAQSPPNKISPHDSLVNLRKKGHFRNMSDNVTTMVHSIQETDEYSDFFKEGAKLLANLKTPKKAREMQNGASDVDVKGLTETGKLLLRKSFRMNSQGTTEINKQKQTMLREGKDKMKELVEHEDWKNFTSSLTNNSVPFQDLVDDFSEIYHKDPRFEELFSTSQNITRKLLEKKEEIGSKDTKDMAQKLFQTGNALFQTVVHNLKEDSVDHNNNNTLISSDKKKEIVEHGKTLLGEIKENQEMKRIIEHSKILLNDKETEESFFQLVRDNRIFLHELQEMLVPLVSEQLLTINIPIIDGISDNRSYAYRAYIIYHISYIIIIILFITIRYQLTDMSLSKLNIPPDQVVISIDDKTREFTLSVNGFSATMKKFQWKYQKLNFPTWKDTGSLNADISNSAGEIKFKILLENGVPTFRLIRIGFLIRKLELKIVETKKKWIYNKLVKIFRKKVRRAVEDKILNSVHLNSKKVQSKLNQLLIKYWEPEQINQNNENENLESTTTNNSNENISEPVPFSIKKTSPPRDSPLVSPTLLKSSHSPKKIVTVRKSLSPDFQCIGKTFSPIIPTTFHSSPLGLISPQNTSSFPRRPHSTSSIQMKPLSSCSRALSPVHGSLLSMQGIVHSGETITRRNSLPLCVFGNQLSPE